MSGSINKAVLIGNVGADPEIRNTQSGDKVATFSLATTETSKNKETGERQSHTEWHKIVVFGDFTEIVAESITKGSKVYIDGKLQTRKYQDKSGSDKYTTEVVVNGFGCDLKILDEVFRGIIDPIPDGFDDLGDEVPPF